MNILFSVIKRLFWSFSLLFLFFFSACQGDEEAVEDLSGVKESDNRFAFVLNDNAAIRLQPQLHTSRVTYAMKGDSVKVVGQSEDKSTIAKINAYWYKVKTANGVEGWTFGSNLKIVEEGDEFSIEEYKKQVAADKLERTVKKLKGKWWSVTKSGNFTSHMLMLYEDGRYKSTRYGKKFEGEYTIDFDTNRLVFTEGSTVGEDVTMVERGQEIFLEKEGEKYNYRFKKIASETDESAKKIAESYQIEDLEPPKPEEKKE